MAKSRFVIDQCTKDGEKQVVDGYIRDSCFDIEQTLPSDLNGLLLKFVHAESIHNLVERRMKLDDDNKIFTIDEHIVHTICCWNFLDISGENSEETLSTTERSINILGIDRSVSHE